MLQLPRNVFHAAPRYQPVLRQIGLDAEAVFTHADIQVWRKIPERENCTLDADLADGTHVRLHVKRYVPARGFRTPADEESLGIRALEIEGIPTVPLVGWGKLVDGRSFVITEDLGGYRDAEKLVRENIVPFESLLEPTADLAARLHGVGLHHRDLYLCHFFARPDDPADLRLIDAARVRRLPGWPVRQRWIVKDLAQFWFSTTSLPVTDEQRARWLTRYAGQRQLGGVDGLRRAIERKSAWIARHDASLRRKQKDRNVSIPG
jgi:heptose I phosphotransferase